MHWPKVSEKKKAELEHLMMSIKTSPLKKSPKSIYESEHHGLNDEISTHKGNNRANSD